MYIIITQDQIDRFHDTYDTLEGAKHQAIVMCDNESETYHVMESKGTASREETKWQQAELPLTPTIDKKRGRQDHESKVFPGNKEVPPYDDPAVIKTLPQGWTKDKPKEWQPVTRDLKTLVTSATGKENG